MAKTSPSHGEGRGSIPLRVTIAYIGVLTAFLTYGITLRKDVCLYIFFPSAYVFKQFAAGEKNLILRNCVTAARQTLTLFVRVQILLPQPYSEAKKDIMASNPRNLTISGVFLAFPRFFAIMRFADTECRKKDIISKKRLRTGFEPCSTRFQGQKVR